ncbi:MAG: hypothetical protein QM625_06305 [Ralstonia sp.]|nr:MULTISPECIES: hypothetical protein [Ralstonia]UCA15023.1 hypothetical protein LA354_03205 [Ralstonia pickettii]
MRKKLPVALMYAPPPLAGLASRPILEGPATLTAGKGRMMEFPMAFSNLYLLLAVCVAGVIGLASAPLVIRGARVGIRVLLTIIGVLIGLLLLEALPVLT